VDDRDGINRIEREIHGLDKRLAVVETRQSAFETSMEEAHTYLQRQVTDLRDDVRGGFADLNRKFTKRFETDSEDRKKIIAGLLGLVVTLITGLGALAYLIMQHTLVR
jgi:hypothetical protein